MSIESFEFRYPTQEDLKKQEQTEIEATRKILKQTEYEKRVGAPQTAEIQLGAEGPETEEALAVHEELKKEVIPGEITAEELKSDDIESALEKLTEDDRDFVIRIVNEAIEENKDNPVVQKFLQFETQQPSLPKEVSRVKGARESLVDTTLSSTLKQRKKLGLKGKNLEESLKKSVLSKITVRVEEGLPKLKTSQ